MARKTTFKTQNEVALEKARTVVKTLKFGTDEWEAAMSVVRELVEKVNGEDQALLNHRCNFES